ncbi:MAG: phospholipid carrier-dependent glycosyltransferase, partial [Chloroflexota bacterium]
MSETHDTPSNRNAPMTAKQTLRSTLWSLGLILLLHLAVSLIYTTRIPLGEAPDELAHLGYAKFIATHGRLPVTLAERQEADYRAELPPLYYLMVAQPLTWVPDVAPYKLKSVGDTPRRLIPTNGQTIASFIHTTDEAWPWRGIVLGWHLSRLISIGFALLTLIVTYLIAWRLTQNRTVALTTTSVQAFIPQFLFIGAVLNEDTLVMFLSSLTFLTLIAYTHPPRLPGVWQTFLLGSLLGLATVAKYNALPLWPVVILWTAWLAYQAQKKAVSLGQLIKKFVVHGLLFILGVGLMSGWWFGFIWQHFNQVEQLGLISGSLASLFTNTTDLTLR